MIDFMHSDDRKRQSAVIKVIGVGGAGGNTINRIIASGYNDVICIVANSDAQALEQSLAAEKIQIGVKSTKGLGTGANPELGKRAAEEDIDKIMEVIGNADIVFLALGTGGGTGSGAAPVIAHALRAKGILSIAIVTKPFEFEGKRRAQTAHNAIEQLKKEVDALIIIPNQKLLELVEYNTPMEEALDMINAILIQSVKGISDIITKPGHINVDFADVRAIMKDMGLAVLGTATVSGQDRARKAALQAISSPLLENMSIDGARGVLLNITGGVDLGLHEISDAASIIYERADANANIILGSVIDKTLKDAITVTVIATGFGQAESPNASVQEQVAGVEASTRDKAEQCTATVSNNALNIDMLMAKEICKKQDEEVVLERAERLSFAMDDLDVPTFLRKEAARQPEE
jgi:cell division protein FtsZ